MKFQRVSLPLKLKNTSYSTPDTSPNLEADSKSLLDASFSSPDTFFGLEVDSESLFNTLDASSILEVDSESLFDFVTCPRAKFFFFFALYQPTSARREVELEHLQSYYGRVIIGTRV